MHRIGADDINKLIEEIEKEGIAVYECNIYEKNKELKLLGLECNETLEGQAEAGFYVAKPRHPRANLSSYPEYSIFINQEISNDDKYLFLLHEFGHHLCFVRQCACMNPDTFHPVAEAHAHEYVIRHLKQGSNFIALFKYVRNIVLLADKYSQMQHLDTQLISLLFYQVLKRERPIDSISEQGWIEIKKEIEIEQIELLTKCYDSIINDSSDRLCREAVSIPDVFREARYLKLVKDLFPS